MACFGQETNLHTIMLDREYRVSNYEDLDSISHHHPLRKPVLILRGSFQVLSEVLLLVYRILH